MKFCFSYLRWENLVGFKCYLLHCCLFSILFYCFLVAFVCSILCIPTCAHSSVKTLISWSICLAINLLPCLGQGGNQWKTCLYWLVVWEFNLFTHRIVLLWRHSIVSNFHGDTDPIVILGSSRRFQYYSWEISSCCNSYLTVSKS